MHTEPGTKRAVDAITLGVIASSRKEREQRVPLHPAQIAEIDSEVRGRILLEEGYGERFQLADRDLASLVGGLLPRERVVDEASILVLPKPTTTTTTSPACARGRFCADGLTACRTPSSPSLRLTAA